MSGDAAIRLVLSVIVIGVIALLAIAIFDALLSSSAALDPGDPLYEQQRGLVDTVAGLLPLLLPGGLAVLAIVFAALGRSGR